VEGRVRASYSLGRLMTELPTGTITFLFTDVEGSTRLLREHGERYGALLAEHRRVLRGVFARYEGVEVDTEGDAFFVAFASARKALAAAREAQQLLDDGPLRVRMGLHTGEAQRSDEGYVGLDVHRAARIAAVGHGGQVLVSAATSALVEVELSDLGAHRLKDLSAPERLYQLGDRTFPPLRTLSHTNLPIPATAFLGRESELEEVTGLLRRDDVRVLTLTGPGGTGKTRLALQAAGTLADDYPDGVFWVPLAPLRDPTLVLPQVAQALGVKLDPREYIGSRRLLLLLDNLEHLLDAAEAVGELVASCPRLGLLVTSRAPLHLDGEWEYAVDPLAENEAVALFEQRARAVSRAFAANGEVAEICRRLDCLPLAIELAAARAKLLPAHAILARLEQRLPLLAAGSRNAPERQRTLRATIEWSHSLLTEEEQRLFARLAVFAGGWELEAAEEICDADLEILGSSDSNGVTRSSVSSSAGKATSTTRTSSTSVLLDHELLDRRDWPSVSLAAKAVGRVRTCQLRTPLAPREGDRRDPTPPAPGVRPRGRAPFRRLASARAAWASRPREAARVSGGRGAGSAWLGGGWRRRSGRAGPMLR